MSAEHTRTRDCEDCGVEFAQAAAKLGRPWVYCDDCRKAKRQQKTNARRRSSWGKRQKVIEQTLRAGGFHTVAGLAEASGGHGLTVRKALEALAGQGEAFVVHRCGGGRSRGRPVDLWAWHDCGEPPLITSLDTTRGHVLRVLGETPARQLVDLAFLVERTSRRRGEVRRAVLDLAALGKVRVSPAGIGRGAAF